MYERREEVTTSSETHPRAVSEHVETVAEDPYAGRRGAAEKLRQAIYLVFGIIEGLIAIRFILRALGANPSSAFAQFIYGVTDPFLAPFAGLFRPLAIDGGVLEWHALVAIVVYMLLAWVLAKVVWLLAGETRRGSRAYVHRVDTDVR